MKVTEYTDHMCEVLLRSSLPLSEVNFRIGRLKDAERKPGSQISVISDAYYSLAHEIKALQFLSPFGNVCAADDSHGRAGCDYVLNERYQIECVCSTSGNADTNGLAEFCVYNTLGKLIDYGKKEILLYSRLTSSLRDKKEFYQKHITAGTMSANLPYIIFLGLGSLSQEMIINPEMNGIEFTGVLLGKGNPTITINSKTQEIVAQGYAFRPRIEKWNHQPIDSAIFCNPEYTGISGILFSSADLYEEYTRKNTWLFINPYAINKITKKDFRNITYWAADRNMIYRAYRNGRRK